MQPPSEPSLHAQEQPLYKVFGDDYVFRIPPYQRPYAWTTEEAGTLLDDLLVAMDPSSPGDAVAYFLGSVVLIKAPGSPEAEVVDGQQRLTTLTILLCALRELASVEQNSQQQDDLNAFIYEVGNQYKGTKDQYRLMPRERDEEFFRTYVQVSGGLSDLQVLFNDELTDSQLNFKKNAELFTARLSEMTSDQRNRLTAYMMKSCYLVVVSAADQDAAYRIFSVLNSRGLDLSPTDILKAEIIGSIDADNRPDYTSKWEDMEVDLGRTSFEELFGHIRMIYRLSKPKGTLVSEFKHHVNPSSDPTRFIDGVLRPMASAFNTIKTAQYKASDDSAKNVNAALTRLQRIDNVDWMPPAIAYFQVHHQEPSLISRFVTDLERLVYGLFILRTYVNDRISRYARIIAEISGGNDLFKSESALQLTGKETENIVTALNADIYSQVKTRLPILLKLDSLLTEGGVVHEPTIITVEHVLPQNPSASSAWRQVFSEEDERLRLTNCLGNLVLLSRSKNSKAQNFEFERKKKEYFLNGGVSTFALTSQVLGHDDWTPGIVRSRQIALVKRLCEAWRLT